MPEVKLLNTESECRLAYLDILNGYSYSPCGNFVLRHFNELDSCLTEKKYNEYLAIAEKQGLLSEKDKLELLDKHGHWTKDEEAEYQRNKQELEGMRFSLPKLFIPQQIEHLSNRIKEKEKSIIKEFGARIELLGTTKESYANRKSHEFHVINTLYKDEKLIERYLSNDELENISEVEIINLLNVHNKVHEKFIEKNFKRIAVCPFFLNAYMISSNNPYYFFGKPAAFLTIYQLVLFNKGGYYKYIIEEPETRKPPEEFYEDLSKVVQHYDKEYSVLMGKRKK